MQPAVISSYRAAPNKRVGGPASIAAATAVANSNPGSSPYLWLIGNKDGRRAMGQVGTPVILPNTQMSIASASKWVYGMFAAQQIVLDGTDWPFLNMSSGYVGMTGQCGNTDSVASCLARPGYDTYYPSFNGVFRYNSAHMEHHAVNRLGIGGDRIIALKNDFEATLAHAPIIWTQPMMAGGIYSTAEVYESLLLDMMNNVLNMGALLGSHQVPASAILGAAYSPAPPNEPWHYSICHWVEPDGTFSSGGSFGFYPWILKDKSWYGIVAMDNEDNDPNTIGLESVRIGQKIRNAWLHP